MTTNFHSPAPLGAFNSNYAESPSARDISQIFFRLVSSSVPSAPLTGTISSSSFKYTVANVIDFAGTFTSDLMQGTFESCPNQICADGTGATGSIGEFGVTRQR